MPQNQPMYRHIADDLRAQIKDGRLKANAKLPTEGDLSDTVRGIQEHRQGGHQTAHGRRPA